jgi:hypothetical protein
LLLNLNGALSDSASWESEPELLTNDVALADLDRDGDLDLVCANSGWNHIYRNLGSALEEAPFWVSALPRDSRAVAVADLNGDGFDDLIFANDLAASNIYMSESGLFDTQPSREAPAEAARDVAAADWDRDGDLDVAFAHHSSRNVLYRNTNGELSFGFHFGPSNQRSTAIALGDVNGDGYPDILTGGENDRVELILNLEGRLPPAPLWPSGFPVTTPFAVTVDVNNDARADFLVGQEGAATVAWVVHTRVRREQPRPPIKNQLTHHDAYSDYLEIESLGYNLYGLRFNLVDVESDSSWVTLYYKPESSPQLEWTPIVPNLGMVTAGPLASSPSGVEHVVEWDVSRIEAPGSDMVVQLRIHERSGVVRELNSRTASLGYVLVEGANIALDGTATPRTVTLGDSATVSIRIRNWGNETLTVAGVRFAQAEPELGLDLDPTPPFGVDPSGSVNLNVTLSSQVAQAREVTVLIESNDRSKPEVNADLRMHVVPLEATSTFPSAVARDRKVTIRLIPEIVQNPWTGGRYVVQIEQAMLVMEPEGAGAELLLEMKRYRSEWYQDVPGVLAGETGFKFHIEYRNGPFVAVDPPGAPGDSLYWIDVHPPAAMTTFVQSDDDFHIGKPIDVIVAMTPGAFFVRGNLYYRRAGVTSYGVTALRLDTVSQQPRATIFPSRVTGRGVEYWVEVETQARMLTDPVTNPAESPHIIRTRVPDVVEDRRLPGGRYRLLSLPLDVGSNTSLETILADVDGLGRHGEGSWRAFVTRPMRGHLELTSRTQVDFRVAPGRSFWLISRRDHQLTTRAVVGRSTPSQPAFAIVLSPGWSAIGNPFLFDVAWESVRTSAAIDPPVGFDPSVGKRGDYVDTDPVVLKPFDGYLIENTSVGRETLWVPSIEFTDATNGTGVKSVTSMTSSAGSQDFEWTLQVRATSATAFDGANVVGVHPEAESGRAQTDTSGTSSSRANTQRSPP